MDDVSFLTPSGYQFSSCGYCKSSNGSPSYYCHGYRDMQPWHYERLANRMWRRSGTIYYKPDTKNACCPHYTIRLDAEHFKVSKDQKHVSNKFTSYVIGDEYKRRAAQLFPRSREEKKRRNDPFDVNDRVHESEWSLLPKREGIANLNDVVPAHRFEVTLESDSFTEEKYVLFEQYQRIVHKEPPSRISRYGFKEFLCSGLPRSTYTQHGLPRPIGSYHQCYRLDGKLVAIGVLDLLPNVVSSVYLVYDSDLAYLEFGKLSALREIAMAKMDGYRYYYMGYYIHSCTKMRYKRTFKPTYVLDPESYDWMLFDDDLLTRFENRQYVSLARENRLGLAVTDKDPEEIIDGLNKGFRRKHHSSIFESGMTGLVPRETIKNSLQPSEIPFFYHGQMVTSPSLNWDEMDVSKPYSMIERIAEFIACIGIENLAQGQIGGLVLAIERAEVDEETEDE